jgi:hypothetical protein
MLFVNSSAALSTEEKKKYINTTCENILGHLPYGSAAQQKNFKIAVGLIKIGLPKADHSKLDDLVQQVNDLQKKVNAEIKED